MHAYVIRRHEQGAPAVVVETHPMKPEAFEALERLMAARPVHEREAHVLYRARLEVL